MYWFELRHCWNSEQEPAQLRKGTFTAEDKKQIYAEELCDWFRSNHQSLFRFQPPNSNQLKIIREQQDQRSDRKGPSDGEMKSWKANGGMSLTHVSFHGQTGADPLPLGKLGPQSPYIRCQTKGSSGWCWWFLLKPAPVGTDTLGEPVGGTWMWTSSVLTMSSAPPATGT